MGDSSMVKYSKATRDIRKFYFQSWSLQRWQVSSQKEVVLGFIHIFRTGSRGKKLRVSNKTNSCVATHWRRTYAWNRLLASLFRLQTSFRSFFFFWAKNKAIARLFIFKLNLNSLKKSPSTWRLRLTRLRDLYRLKVRHQTSRREWKYTQYTFSMWTSLFYLYFILILLLSYLF